MNREHVELGEELTEVALEAIEVAKGAVEEGDGYLQYLESQAHTTKYHNRDGVLANVGIDATTISMTFISPNDEEVTIEVTR